MVTIVAEYRVVGNEPHCCAVGFVTFCHTAVVSHFATSILYNTALSVAHTLDVEVCRQCIDGFYADTVESYRLLECF